MSQNSSGTGDYTKAIRDGRFAAARGHVFTGDDKLRARIIEALMCDFAVSTDESCDSFGVTPAALAAVPSGRRRLFPALST